MVQLGMESPGSFDIKKKKKIKKFSFFAEKLLPKNIPKEGNNFAMRLMLKFILHAGFLRSTTVH